MRTELTGSRAVPTSHCSPMTHGVDVELAGGEVLAEQPRAERPAELLAPPVEVLLGEGVDGW